MDYLTAFIFSKNKISNYFSSIKETNNFCLFFFLTIVWWYENLLKKHPCVRLAPHAHSMSILRRYLLPCVVLLDLNLPLLSSLRGFNPAHPTSIAAVANVFMSTPNSAIICIAPC